MPIVGSVDTVIEINIVTYFILSWHPRGAVRSGAKVNENLYIDLEEMMEPGLVKAMLKLSDPSLMTSLIVIPTV